MRKFGTNCEYILAYLDYLSHLNEDNNTRVLFGRVLAQGTLKPDDSLEIWNKFLEFESNIGDLASVVKVEYLRCSDKAARNNESGADDTRDEAVSQRSSSRVYEKI